MTRFYKPGSDETQIDQISLSGHQDFSYLFVFSKTNQLLLFQLSVDDKGKLVVTKTALKIQLQFYAHNFIW